MRLRTLVTLATGAAAGAGAMYLLDPEHGPARRREVRRSAVRHARSGATSALHEGARQLREIVQAAAEGYRQGQAPNDGR